MLVEKAWVDEICELGRVGGWEELVGLFTFGTLVFNGALGLFTFIIT